MTCVTHHRISYFSREEIFLSFFFLLFRRNIWKMEKVFFFFYYFISGFFFRITSVRCNRMSVWNWNSYFEFHCTFHRITLFLSKIYISIWGICFDLVFQWQIQMLIAFVIIISCKLKKLFLNKSSLRNLRRNICNINICNINWLYVEC